MPSYTETRYEIGAARRKGDVMDMIYVDSTNVDQIGFDEDAGEAHVIFKNGRHYIYSEVSAEIWEKFRDSPSKGTFLNQEFKAKSYPCREA
jgi:hypothetical protein